LDTIGCFFDVRIGVCKINESLNEPFVKRRIAEKMSKARIVTFGEVHRNRDRITFKHSCFVEIKHVLPLIGVYIY